jgi:hypothetical protein
MDEPTPSRVFETDGHEQPTMRYGLQRMHYQFSVSIPVIHLTLASIIQGIAFSTLIDHIFLPIGIPQSNLFDFLQRQTFYIPHIISSTIIIMAWLDFCDAAVNNIWPLSLLQAGFIYVVGLAEVLAFKELDSFPLWLIGVGCIAIVGGIVHANNKRVHSARFEFEDIKAGEELLNTEIKNGLLFILSGCFTIAMSLAFIWMSRLWPQYSSLLRLSISAIVSANLVYAVKVDYDTRQKRLKNCVRGSDLVVTRFGGLRYSGEYKGTPLHLLPDLPPSASHKPDQLSTVSVVDAVSSEADFKLLFDNTTMNKWQMSTIKNQPGRDDPGHFIVVDDAIVAVPGTDPGLYWYTEPTPANFILALEWRSWRESDDSGVFVRLPHPDSKGYNNTAFVGVDFGFEVQISQNGAPDGASIHKTGAIYDFAAPTEMDSAFVHPAGQWNQFEIHVQGQRYAVYLNGVQINIFAYVIGSDHQHLERGLPSTPESPRFVGLQTRVGHTAFRNMRLKPLKE